MQKTLDIAYIMKITPSWPRGSLPRFPQKTLQQFTAILLRSGEWTLVILNKGQTTIWEEIETYAQEKLYTIERLLVDKNIGLVNTE